MRTGDAVLPLAAMDTGRVVELSRRCRLVEVALVGLTKGTGSSQLVAFSSHGRRRCAFIIIVLFVEEKHGL